MAPHYYQAYVQAYSNPPRTTADGYTLSSTYVPGTTHQTRKATTTNRPSMQAQSQTTAKPILNRLTYGSWYQPGNCKCTRQGCPFTGSPKSVEIHMMDRHFIFPPGWEKKDNWDADLSLRGKSIAIQGTSLVLDTPEALDAWIAERKRRFPTNEKIQDKKRKLEEAVARGQLTPEDIGAGARKKHRQHTTVAEGGSKGFRGKGYQRGRGRGRKPGGLVQREKPRTENVGDSTSLLVDTTTKCTREASPKSAPVADDDEAPEVVSSKVPTASICIPKVDAGHDRQAQTSHGYPQECPKRISQPKKPPRNPFVSRSTLLRNLLLPEIRVTVSNLSQAIHFLVENDFLRGIELRPGEAQEQMIEVLGSSESPRSAQLPAPQGEHPTHRV
ncbi:hypothetical protein L210DRAFT_975988 [Boletus edulis BED1]|uniref:FMR1-interacting protein 1 conserved domain-containing protein n=1 Tax=Boletus edulis BED1 TaxID=1328754 RepID=A0AAD4GHY2_BOLED|nr:hypothetical protein L210DRAFT_975988 [Boletus edulis BED1]